MKDVPYVAALRIGRCGDTLSAMEFLLSLSDFWEAKVLALVHPRKGHTSACYSLGCGTDNLTIGESHAGHGATAPFGNILSGNRAGAVAATIVALVNRTVLTATHGTRGPSSPALLIRAQSSSEFAH